MLPVDSGETAAARNVPFARFEVSREQELPAVMAASGLSVDDVSEVVLTHHHGDHVEGLVHLRARARINEVELPACAAAREQERAQDAHAPGRKGVDSQSDAT